MRKLGEILDDARTGGKPEYDELRYAVCVLEALLTFDDRAMQKLYEAEDFGKKPQLIYSAKWQYEERFGRIKRAMEVNPKDYLGWNNDPDNPEVGIRRKALIKAVENLMDGKEKF